MKMENVKFNKIINRGLIFVLAALAIVSLVAALCGAGHQIIISAMSGIAVYGLIEMEEQEDEQ
jgi:hypothetical protein